MFHILDNIYLSNLRQAENSALINEKDIDIVIRLSEDINKTIYPPNIMFINYELEDNIFNAGNMLKIAIEVNDIILKNSKSNILIHCNQGQSRSVSVIIFYMIASRGYDYLSAFDHIKHIKPDISPNGGFANILKEYNDKINIDGLITKYTYF